MAESLGLKTAGGAIVSSVEVGSAADRAGIKRNDIIKAFNGQPVEDTNALRNRVAEAKPGSSATVVIDRNGSERTLTVMLGEADTSARAAGPREGTSGDDNSTLGVRVTPLTPDLATRNSVPKDVHGVLVQDVNPDGRAAAAGIREGDVIQEVNRQPVQTVEELQAAVRGASNRPVLLLVNREGQDRFVTVRPS